MKKSHITIHDIAKELEISASTVSRALNNNPRISPSTRKAVQELALKYNYQPNVLAASLRKGKGNTVGVRVKKILTIEDEYREISEAMRQMIREFPLVISTGGLGPTKDDRTKTAIARILKTSQVLDKRLATEIEKAINQDLHITATIHVEPFSVSNDPGH